MFQQKGMSICSLEAKTKMEESIRRESREEGKAEAGEFHSPGFLLISGSKYPECAPQPVRLSVVVFLSVPGSVLPLII